jgi:hypothetical protein
MIRLSGLQTAIAVQANTVRTHLRPCLEIVVFFEESCQLCFQFRINFSTKPKQVQADNVKNLGIILRITAVEKENNFSYYMDLKITSKVSSAHCVFHVFRPETGDYNTSLRTFL